jgi:hypothetical protein
MLRLRTGGCRPWVKKEKSSEFCIQPVTPPLAVRYPAAMPTAMMMRPAGLKK